MGGSPRPRPNRLAEKLFQIRLGLGLTQAELFERLDYSHSSLFISHISAFELGKREPPLPLLLRYARVAGIALEVLADDDLDLPAQLVKKAEAAQTERITLGQCPYCDAQDKQIKAGYNRSGSARYQCRKCMRRYTPEPEGFHRLHQVRPPQASSTHPEKKIDSIVQPL